MSQWNVLWISCLLMISAAKLESRELLYAGAVAGEPISQLNADKMGVNHADLRTYSFGGRLFVGVRCTDEISVESGYWIIRPIDVPSINHVPRYAQIKQHFWDVALKASWPLPHHYSLYSKIGAGSYTLNPDDLVRCESQSDFKNDRIRHFRPFGALGAGYDINKNWGIDASWQYSVKHRALASLNAVFLGIIYHPNRS